MNTEKKLFSLINSARVLTSTLDLDKVLHQLIKEVLNVIEGSNASVLFLYDQKTNKLYPKAAVGFNMKYLKDILLDPGEGMSGKTFLSRDDSVVMVTVCTSMIFTWVLISEGIPKWIAEMLHGLGLPGWALLLVLIAIMLVAGMVMELVPNLFLFIPIFFPIAAEIGMDPTQFAIVMLVSLALGMFTPPVGATLFISCYIAKVGIEKTIKDILPYFVAGIVVVLLIAYVPFFTLWLPEWFE
ncbi:SLC13 family permease [Halalkalibacter alkalisediminis]|uniref:SLC13 family permease n=1 Tax=Halalkalibacter alkalisediminis TaxID=935616 RepID=A0ABV6NKP0_9BACI|nr:SLC13 family permease [Halalkalibacter alkalisediminis]